MGKREKYSLETESAWYALKQFINPLDCSKRYLDSVITMNTNSVLSSIFSASKRYKPSYFTKTNLNSHLNRCQTYYYRSCYNKKYTEGYGSSDKQSKNQMYSDIFNINTKSTKYEMYVLLLAIDIDCHNGEEDVLEVKNWIKDTYFNESYWEPSTGGKGQHGYIKIAYNTNTSIVSIISILQELFKILDSKRKELEFKSKIDMPCGLPSTISFEKENPYIEEEPNLKKVNNLYLRINRSQTIKIPRFNNTNFEKCNIEDILSFYNKKYYSFDYFENLLNTFKNAEKGEKASISIKNKDIIEKDLDNSNNINESNVVYKLDSTIVCSPSANTEKETTGLPSKKPLEKDEIQKLYKSKICLTKDESYLQRIEECRRIKSTYTKCNKFYFYYSLYLNSIPSVEDAINEYISQNLNTTKDKDSNERVERFNGIKLYLEKKFKISKDWFNIEKWNNTKNTYIAKIQEKVKEDSLFWLKDKKKKYSLTYEELAIVYFAIEESNIADKDVVGLIKNSFSYQKIGEIFKNIYDKSCHKGKIARILKLLQSCKLIRKNGNYVPGIKGNSYIISDLDTDENDEKIIWTIDEEDKELFNYPKIIISPTTNQD